MKNKEFYKDIIMDFSGEFCKDFVKPKVLEPKGIKCETTVCAQCHIIVAMWLEEEYQEPEEPEINWEEIPIDSPIFVRVNKELPWEQRHFAKYENGKVYAWENGTTSWSGNGEISHWRYAKLIDSWKQAKEILDNQLSKDTIS